MLKVNNPILRGFNPDPSIIRVDDDYYIATSTFEWFPGVQIHHSRDLVNWRLLTRPLRRISQLDLRGVRASGGIWAPCLSCDGNLFYLVYTVVKTDQKPFMDAHNYLVTSKTIDGEWSEPVFLNSMGFDPSMFHDDDEIQTLYLKSDVCHDILCFEYSTDEIHWQRIGESCDASRLSDEACREGGFTGAFVGVCCYDLTGEKLHADFDFFEYIEN